MVIRMIRWKHDGLIWLQWKTQNAVSHPIKTHTDLPKLAVYTTMKEIITNYIWYLSIKKITRRDLDPEPGTSKLK